MAPWNEKPVDFRRQENGRELERLVRKSQTDPSASTQAKREYEKLETCTTDEDRNAGRLKGSWYGVQDIVISSGRHGFTSEELDWLRTVSYLEKAQTTTEQEEQGK